MQIHHYLVLVVLFIVGYYVGVAKPTLLPKLPIPGMGG
jgi:hypothetical protein